MNPSARILLTSALFLLTLSSHAVVTTVAQYRLGETDAGAVAGGAGAATTTPSVGAVSLAKSGTPTYSASVPAFINGSTLSMSFNGTTDRYSSSSMASPATDNFGLEAWVNAADTTANTALAYVGQPGSSGWGLMRFGSTWGALFGGNVVINSSATVATNAWTHLALVRAGGITTLYVNGAVVATDGTAPNTPVSGETEIGSNLSNGEFFHGLIDEVRVFTFAAGAFTLADLNLSRPVAALVPVGNSTLTLLLALGVLLVAGWAATSRRRT